jgi:alkyl hydroperoxide reductase subunit D
MNWVDQLKEALPDYAKDTKLNLDAVINRSTLDAELANGCALAAALATGNGKLVSFIQSGMVANGIDVNPALAAAAIMAQNNVWYPYVEMAEDPNLSGLPAQLRMNAIANHGGTTKLKFEAYSLSSSIVGKCHFCVKAHYETLKKEGMSVEQLRDIGRIAAVINSLAKVLNG